MLRKLRSKKAEAMIVSLYLVGAIIAFGHVMYKKGKFGKNGTMSVNKQALEASRSWFKKI